MKPLTKIAADNRGSLITEYINYNVFLKLLDQEYFEGIVSIIFNLKDVNRNIFVDFNGRNIYQIYINNNSIPNLKIFLRD